MRRILGMGGGGWMMEPDNPLLDDYLLSLTDSARPRVCFVPTASGDHEPLMERFEAAFPATRARTSVLRLFRREVTDVGSFLGEQDVIYVGGGNTVSLLAVWRAHGVVDAVTAAYDAGTVLAGISAGMICWFEESLTDSYGGLDRLGDGLGLIRGSACPHFDGEPGRRPRYRELVRAGMAPGWAADDGCGLLFEEGELSEVVSSRPHAGAWRVELRDGEVLEKPLEVRYLGDDLDVSFRVG